MSIPKKLTKVIQTLYQESIKTAQALPKRLMTWLLRNLMILRHRSHLTRAGFILPTVTMVILVVALLTTAIVFRSFDRAKNASNVRVNEAVLKAATPAIDRAKAKLDELFTDPTLPRATPSEEALATVFIQKKTKYTLGDEERLEIEGEGDPVWRFPVDTNNDGKFDSFTYYGIFFKTPLDEQESARDPQDMEARTPPMDEGTTNKQCTELLATSASLVGGRGYYKVGSKLKKSIFVYTATVPITDLTGLDLGTYQEFPGGNKGFSALEYQQDRSRIPLSNNAVVYEDDLAITPGEGTTFNLNGRIMTNGNLLIGNGATASNPTINLYLVSSAESCFYQEENSKILVGGNVGIGAPDGPERSAGANVHTFEEGVAAAGTPPGKEGLGTGNKSVTNNPQEITSNNLAYAQRIDHLVNNTTGGDPDEVTNRSAGTSRDKALENYFKERTRRVPFVEVPLGTAQTLQNPTGSGDNLRPVNTWILPFDETNNQTSNNSLSLKFNGDFLDPPATEPETQQSLGKEKRLGDRLLVGNALPAKWWNGTSFAGEETEQPVLKNGNDVFWNEPDDEPRFRTTQMRTLSDLGDTDRNGFWERMAAQQPTQPLEGIGGLRVVTGAGLYVDDNSITGDTPRYPRNNPTRDSKTWESYLPVPSWDLRFVDPSDSDTNRIHVSDLTTQLGGNTPIIVWPDTMPMSGGEGDLTGNNGANLPANQVNSDFAQKGDLLMRASVVYHYGSGAGTNPAQEDGNKNQTPIACVSSYYDPTDAITAQNEQTLTTNWENPLAATGLPTALGGRTGKSNNGIVYTYSSVAGIPESNLARQARLVYPDGRLVNEPLLKALNTAAGDRLWADYAAIHAARCAEGILRGVASVDSSGTIPHGAIYETTLLDARQLKAIHQELPQYLGSNPDYDLEIEDRQPSEVRVTVLDLQKLRTTTATASANGPSPEFLLPNSGIIYASRDDALPDLSHDPTNLTDIDTRERFSPVDFKLDPTRRPNGIMLRNGTILARQDESNSFILTSPPGAEKGLILASNLPVYVKADLNSAIAGSTTTGFNLHQNPSGTLVEEFSDNRLAVDGWTEATFYNRTTKDPSFACRADDPRLPSCSSGGDLWRPATVLGDSVTLLSSNFRFGFRNEGGYDQRNNMGHAQISQPIDLNNLNGIEAAATFNETVLNLDLNGDGDKVDNITVDESNPPLSLVRLFNGFFDNDYGTSYDWVEPTTGQPQDLDSVATRTQGSSYLNNYITPIQRRVPFPEYVMEICRKVPVSSCGPNDWVVGFDGDGDGELDNTEKAIKAFQLGQALVAAGKTDASSDDSLEDGEVNWARAFTTGSNSASPLDRLGAGTTARPALDPADQRYPRRVAFARDANDQLEPVTVSGNPVYKPMGVGCPLDATGTTYSNNGCTYPPTPTWTANVHYGTITATNNALWFRTTNNRAGQPNQDERYTANRPLFYDPPISLLGQPRLVPVLQVHTLTSDPDSPRKSPDALPLEGGNIECLETTNWLQQANTNGEIFNLIAAGGDTPPRPSEQNGGLENYVRLLERWAEDTTACGTIDTLTAQISGSFIQTKRSAYATAPFLQSLTDPSSPTPLPSRFGYATTLTGKNAGPAFNRYSRLPYSSQSGGRNAYYTAANRLWGYDVGLLSQLPDLFSQRFTTPPAGEPDEFLREVGRNDPWVEALVDDSCRDTTANDDC
ncbi:hormogonium polysaccharide biosynthesis protein HpsA [Coleofasciculus sp. E1-EBD-02]|uniref:hormogonium polysaccharide biosynthesis protein HpsA n=1 Tax=Coleofasciculus sp. E1-EBD-02 TaxID=3068481 RepID=UPI0032F6B2B8